MSPKSWPSSAPEPGGTPRAPCWRNHTGCCTPSTLSLRPWVCPGSPCPESQPSPETALPPESPQKSVAHDCGVTTVPQTSLKPAPSQNSTNILEQTNANQKDRLRPFHPHSLCPSPGHHLPPGPRRQPPVAPTWPSSPSPVPLTTRAIPQNSPRFCLSPAKEEERAFFYFLGTGNSLVWLQAPPRLTTTCHSGYQPHCCAGGCLVLPPVPPGLTTPAVGTCWALQPLPEVPLSSSPPANRCSR